jgi:predicted TIM-barrel fold metal-dependent hydrolase
MRIDVHQHIWTESLLAALANRSALPFVRRTNGLTVLHSAGEQPYVIDVDSERPERRARLVREDGIDVALIALSSPIGIEALPREAADGLIAAHLDGVGELPGEFAAWGPIALEQAEAEDVDRVLARGCIGLSLPAAALTGPEALEHAGPLLQRAAERRVPVLIHPGAGAGKAEASLNEPLWWRALTDYVAQMQAAWLTFAAFGRREHPDLAVVFAMLAGGAPLLSERLEARGGPPVALRDPLSFYDTSSYGPVTIEAMARRVGPDQLVYGSDRPVVEPVPTGRETLLAVNGSRLVAA